jgi:hypothetical protein
MILLKSKDNPKIRFSIEGCGKRWLDYVDNGEIGSPRSLKPMALRLREQVS